MNQNIIESEYPYLETQIESNPVEETTKSPMQAESSKFSWEVKMLHNENKNMMNDSLKRTLTRSELCKTICLIDKDINLVAIVNKNGRIIDSKFNNTENLNHISVQELEMITMQRTLQTTMIKEFDNKLSFFRNTVTLRKSLVEFVYPLDDEILLVISKAAVDIKQLSDKLFSLISSFCLSHVSTKVI